MAIKIREATAEDIPAIGRIACKAFHPSTDPITGNLFPPHLQSKDKKRGDPARPWREARKAAYVHDDSGREAVLVAVDDEDGAEDKVVGFVIWELPVSQDRTETAKPKKAPEPPPELDQNAFSEMIALVQATTIEVLGKDGVDQVYHLEYIGVDPSQQKRGIGKMLLNWGLGKATEDDKNCYLFATAVGRRLYEGAGFDVVKVVPVFGHPHYAMIRQASEPKVLI